MEIQEQRHGAVAVLRPIGPLVQSDAQGFRHRVMEVLKENLGRLAVDASRVPYLDSEGLEALVDISDQMTESRRTLKLCAANETLREAFELTGLAPLFEYFQDVNAAVRSFL